MAAAALTALALLAAAPAAAGPYDTPPGVTLASPTPPPAPAIGSAYTPPEALAEGNAASPPGATNWVIDICRFGQGSWYAPDPAVIQDGIGVDKVTFRLCLNFVPPPGSSGVATPGPHDWFVAIVFGATPGWGTNGSFIVGPTDAFAHTGETAITNQGYGYDLVLVKDGQVVDVLDPVLVAGASGLAATVPAVQFADHFRCYGVARPGKFRRRRVTLTDQFETDLSVRLLKPDRLCNPAQKNREQRRQTREHLTCYRLPERPPERDVVQVEDQFFAHVVEVGQPQRLCVPSLKRIVRRRRARPPRGQPEVLDHYKCYRVTPRRVRQTARFRDQFERVRLELRTLVELCNPVNKNGEGIREPDAHLTCYLARTRLPFQRRLVLVRNQFGVDPLAVFRRSVVCLPAFKSDPCRPPCRPPQEPPPGQPPPNRTLTVQVNGNGRVTSDPAGISCPPDCNETYPNGTNVQLMASPPAQFTGWGGDCAPAGTNPACGLTMDADRSASAGFR